MLPIDPQIVHAGQWLLFLAVTAIGIWGTGYLLWVSVQLGTQWYAWLERKREFQREKLRTDTSHYQAVKALELKALQSQHDIALARDQAHNVALNAALVQVGGVPSASEPSAPPTLVKSLG